MRGDGDGRARRGGLPAWQIRMPPTMPTHSALSSGVTKGHLLLCVRVGDWDSGRGKRVISGHQPNTYIPEQRGRRFPIPFLPPFLLQSAFLSHISSSFAFVRVRSLNNPRQRGRLLQIASFFVIFCPLGMPILRARMGADVMARRVFASKWDVVMLLDCTRRYKVSRLESYAPRNGIHSWLFHKFLKTSSLRCEGEPNNCLP